MEQSAETRSLRDYLRAINARRRLVIVVTLVAIAAAIVYSVAQTPVYKATATVNVDASFNQAQNQQTFAGSAGQEGAAAVTQPDVLKAASKTLGGDPTPDGLSTDLDVAGEASVDVVDITAQSDTADKSARVANAVANSAVNVTRQKQAANALALANATDDPATARLYRVQAQGAGPIKLGRVALSPGSPISPKPLRNVVFAALLGLLLGVGLALLRDGLDRTVSDADEVEAALGLPLLGYVRSDLLGMGATGANGAGPGGESLDAFRILKANSEFLAGDQPLNSVAITSALPEEGKSTVAAWYAYVNALAGRRTLLIECDLRRPVLAERFGLELSPGLSEYLGGQSEPTELLRSIPVEGPTAEPLSVIPAGEVPAQPSELIGSVKFGRFLEQVSEAYDLVVLDCPPLLPVGDTLSIVPRVKGAMLCVRVGQTTLEQAVAARAALRRLPQRPVGLVITGVEPGGQEDYSGFYDSQRASDEGLPLEPRSATGRLGEDPVEARSE
jgi:succinoglycan biosynthesis transport protein ExoP